MCQGELSRSAQDARRACPRSDEDEWCCSAGLSLVRLQRAAMANYAAIICLVTRAAI